MSRKNARSASAFSVYIRTCAPIIIRRVYQRPPGNCADLISHLAVISCDSQTGSRHLYLMVSFSAAVATITRTPPDEVLVENSGLHEAGPAERRAAQAERVGYVDSRGRVLRSERARRLRARRGASPERKASRRGRGHHGWPGASPAG